MFAKRYLAMVAVLVLSLSANLARAQQAPAGGKSVVDVVGQVVITCVRPSTLTAEAGMEPKVTGHKFSSPKSGRLDLFVKMRWHGAFTGNPYDSTFTVKIHHDKSGIEVLGIDYTDDCLFPAPDVRLLNSAIRILNESLNKNSR